MLKLYIISIPKLQVSSQYPQTPIQGETFEQDKSYIPLNSGSPTSPKPLKTAYTVAQE